MKTTAKKTCRCDGKCGDKCSCKSGKSGCACGGRGTGAKTTKKK